MVYSDGLPEARPDLPTDPVALAPHLAGNAGEIVARLVALAAGVDRPDDLTVVVLRRAEAG